MATPIDARHTLPFSPVRGALILDNFDGVDSDLNHACRDIVEKEVWEIITTDPVPYLTSLRSDHPTVIVRQAFERLFQGLRRMVTEISKHLSAVVDTQVGDVLEDDLLKETEGILAGMKEVYHEAQRGHSRKPWVCIIVIHSIQNANRGACVLPEIPKSLHQPSDTSWRRPRQRRPDSTRALYKHFVFGDGNGAGWCQLGRK